MDGRTRAIDALRPADRIRHCLDVRGAFAIQPAVPTEPARAELAAADRGAEAGRPRPVGGRNIGRRRRGRPRAGSDALLEPVA